MLCSKGNVLGVNWPDWHLCSVIVLCILNSLNFLWFCIVGVIYNLSGKDFWKGVCCMCIGLAMERGRSRSKLYEKSLFDT